MAVDTGVDIRIEWLAAPDVSTPELAASWARYEIWVDGRCATQVEATDGTYRRSVYGSLYPLAEWIAMNWWMLTAHLRPSSVEGRYWTWSNAGSQRWLSAHNFRAAGDGMAWPDLTVVSEGSMARIRWTPDELRGARRLLFVSAGDAWLPSGSTHQSLARLVDHVLDRLAEQGLPKTRLAEEWTAVGGTDKDEREFCLAAARLGLDPYTVDDAVGDSILSAAEDLPAAVAADFFDSADSSALQAAVDWWKRSARAAGRAALKARRSLDELDSARLGSATSFERPWLKGYAMAREVRARIEPNDTVAFDTTPWVGTAQSTAPAHGIQGAIVVNDSRCGFVPGGIGLAFGRARALGRALLTPENEMFVLSAARSDDERVARAFAAELLAPASGIQKMLDAIGRQDDYAIEQVARRFNVSPLVVRHQYDNQLVTTRGWGQSL